MTINIFAYQTGKSFLLEFILEGVNYFFLEKPVSSKAFVIIFASRAGNEGKLETGVASLILVNSIDPDPTG